MERQKGEKKGEGEGAKEGEGEREGEKEGGSVIQWEIKRCWRDLVTDSARPDDEWANSGHNVRISTKFSDIVPREEGGGAGAALIGAAGVEAVV